MYVAVSAGGVYRAEDGGATWQARNNGVRVLFLPKKYPELGQCVDKIVLHESRPERLFLQNRLRLKNACAAKMGGIAGFCFATTRCSINRAE